MNSNKCKKEVPVFFATDDNYAPFLAVALTSLLENASKDYLYKIHVLTTNLNKNYIDELSKIVSQIAPDYAVINFVSLREEMERSSGFSVRAYYSKETYCRMFIPRLFPQYDKVLYLDCDIVVVGDISELYDIDLGDNLLAAAHEEVIRGNETFCNYVEKTLGVPWEDYFGAGILLINSAQYRKENVEQQFMDLMDRFTFIVAQDQDYLNVLCKGRTIQLDIGWNRTAFKRDDFDDKDLKIIHYKINWKPWHYDDILYEDYFWKYAKKTFAYEQLLKIKDSFTEELKERDNLQMVEMLKMCQNEMHDPNNYWNTMCREKSKRA